MYTNIFKYMKGFVHLIAFTSLHMGPICICPKIVLFKQLSQHHLNIT